MYIIIFIEPITVINYNWCIFLKWTNNTFPDKKKCDLELNIEPHFPALVYVAEQNYDIYNAQYTKRCLFSQKRAQNINLMAVKCIMYISSLFIKTWSLTKVLFIYE